MSDGLYRSDALVCRQGGISVDGFAEVDDPVDVNGRNKVAGQDEVGGDTYIYL
jgi:hypothetical protein